MNDSPHYLRAINLSCHKKTMQQELFNDADLLFSPISFTLNAQELLMIEGPNGSGKTSLLHVLCGLTLTTHGELFWQHQRVTSSHTYFNQCHFIGHTNGIKLGLTVLENINLLNYFSAGMEVTQTIELEHLLQQLHLWECKDTPAKYLSAGQKRRIALAKLFMIPKIMWILDEPFTSLDTASQQLFLNVLTEHIKKGGMAIMSTHQKISLPHLAQKNIYLHHTHHDAVN